MFNVRQLRLYIIQEFNETFVFKNLRLRGSTFLDHGFSGLDF